jgi:polysaccharide biosynthesis protein PslG
VRLKKVLVGISLFVIGSSLIVKASAQIPPALDTFSRNLTIGDYGGDVFSLQAILIAEKFLKLATPSGYFDSTTADAVAGWQNSVGLPSTGYFGPLSRDEIEGKTVVTQSPKSIPAPKSVPTYTSATSTVYSKNETIGDSGPEISTLQSVLISGGYLQIAAPTGYFGVLTSAALADWQAATGLPNTGYFGPLSRAKIATVVSIIAPHIPTAEADTLPSTTIATPISTPTIIPKNLNNNSSFLVSGGGGGGSSPTTPAPTPQPSPTPIISSSSTSSLPENNSTPPTTTSTTQATSTISIPLPTSTPIIVSTTTSLNNNFGVSVGSGFFNLSSSTQKQELNSVVSLGAAWIRFDIQWKVVQAQGSSTYDWAAVDQVVSEANADHLRMLALLDYAPTWAASPSCAAGTNCPPANPSLYATFVTAAATRYIPEGLTDFEIWNEPNNAAFWGSQANCVDYTADLKAAYTAIKAVDPNAGVITGGLAPESTDGQNISPTDFLTCIYQNGGEKYFDAVADHPYSFPETPSQEEQGAWGQMSETTPSLRSIMVANGDGYKRIWATEFGAPTDGPDSNWYVSEASQSAMVTDALGLYESYSWAGPLFWYTLQDNGTSTSTQENFFGLLRFDGSEKPAYSTLQSIIATTPSINY